MIHLERYGFGGRMYVALHGWGGSNQTFAPLAPYIPDFASLYAADLPGYGRSPRPAVTPTADDIAAAVAREIERLAAREITLVGNCSGAIFALLAASRQGSRVRRLVLIDPFAFVPWYFRVFIHPAFGRCAYYSTFANPAGRWLTNASLRRKRASGTNLTASFRQVDHDVSLQYLAMLDALGDISRFRTVDLPVDIVYGERTFGAVRQSLTGWQEVMPQARLWQVDGAGHLPIEEAPRRIASIVFGTAVSGRAS
jgi:pimeloyl-ACP methyl ester carboxylesterase